MNQRQGGFSLIELIVAVVILGILAAVGIPKMVDIERQARIAKVKAMAGAISSGATIVHSKAILNGVNVSANRTSMTMDDGAELKLAYGFPDNKDDTTMQWIVQDMGDFTYKSGSYSLPNLKNCKINYKNAKQDSGPQITLSQQCN